MSSSSAETDYEAWAAKYFGWKRGGTLFETLQRVFGAYCGEPCLGTRVRRSDGTLGPYAFLSFSETWTKAQTFGSGLINALAGQRGQFVAICAQNVELWVLADLASVMYGYVLVPMHVTVDVATARYIVEHSESSVLIAQRDVFAKCAEATLNNANLRLVVSIDAFELFDADQRSAVSAFRRRGVVVTTVAAVMAAALTPFRPLTPLTDPEAIYTVLYTSGSTGVPKGAVMTTRRWNDFICAPYLMPNPIVELSMAPLAHVAERQGVWLTFCCGGSVGFFNGSMERIFDDFAALRPTMHSATPRFWNRIYSEFQVSLSARVAAEPHRALADVEADVLGSFSSLLGDRIQFLVTGSASTSATVKDFMRRCFKVPVYDGYGTTEAGGISTDDVISRDVDVKLEDVPDLGYLNSDKPYPRGEICVRTKVMIQSYYKNAAATAAAFTPDGYFRTGDIGQRESSTVVRIIDRRKSVFKLGNGEFVAPERLEQHFARSDLIAQLCIVGDTSWDCLLAVVVPNRRVLVQRGVDTANDAAVAQALLADMRRIGSEAGLASYEVPWRVLVEWAEFTAANGLLTYSDKMQRRAVEDRYRARLVELYSSLSKVEASAVSAAIDSIVAPGDAVDSLSVVRLQSMLRNKFAVDLSVSQLLQAAASKDSLVQLATGPSRAGSNTAEEAKALQAAVASDIAALSVTPSNAEQAPSDAARPRTILLTGASGFIGSFVLARLMNGAVTVTVTCATQFGESVALCGSVPQLGSWDVAQAQPLYTSAAVFPQWQCTIELPRDTDIEFKFVVRRPAGGVAFEAFDGNRRVRVPAGVDATLDCGAVGERSEAAVRDALPLPQRVVCIVRAADDAAAAARLADVLRKYDIALPPLAPAALQVLAGDVGAPRFGLAPATFDELASAVDTVIHCAASVNWLSSYAQLRSSNVVGTATVLQFVGSGRRKALVHVSTIGVSAGVADGDFLAPERFHQSSGYNVSKLAAERLVQAFANGGGCERCCVVRPGMVAPHPLTGACNRHDYIARYVAGCRLLGAFIDEPAAILEMIPINWVAQQIVRVATAAPASDVRVVTATLTNVERSPSYRAVGLAAVEAGGGGASMQLLPYAQWQARLQSAAPSNPLYPLLPFFPRERLAMQWQAVETGRSDWLLRHPVDSRPEITHDVLKSMVRGVVAEPQNKKRN